MLSWPSNSLVVLALTAGALSPCVLPSSVCAGDKIEFSAPDTSLVIPHVEREENEPLRSGIQSSTSADDPIMDDNIAASSEVVIITAPKRKAEKSRDSSDTDNQYGNSDADNSYDKLGAGQQPNSGLTSRRDMQNDRYQDERRVYSDKRGDELAHQGDLSARLDAESKGRGAEYQRDKRYGIYSSDSDDDSVWSSGYSHRGLLGLVRMRDGQLMSPYEEMKALSEQSSQENLSARPSSTEDKLSSNPTLTSTTADFTMQDGKTPDQTENAPRMRQPVETQAAIQNNDRFGTVEPPASPPGQVQSRPAILPFPKKPGSLLQ